VKQADENIEVSTHGQEANYEYIAKVNPDLIFVVDRTAVVGGTNHASSTLDNELVNGTNAAKNGAIISLNPDIWYLSGGGIASVMQMVSDVEAAIK
jgi:iron complex transport system substrate-binding protein